jgi:hypothetical protein
VGSGAQAAFQRQAAMTGQVNDATMIAPNILSWVMNLRDADENRLSQ